MAEALPPILYACGAPGCTVRLEGAENLLKHITDAHYRNYQLLDPNMRMVVGCIWPQCPRATNHFHRFPALTRHILNTHIVPQHPPQE